MRHKRRSNAAHCATTCCCCCCCCCTKKILLVATYCCCKVLQAGGIPAARTLGLGDFCRVSADVVKVQEPYSIARMFGLRGSNFQMKWTKKRGFLFKGRYLIFGSDIYSGHGSAVSLPSACL